VRFEKKEDATLKELTDQQLVQLFSHMPRFGRAFHSHPPVLPEGLPDMNMTHFRALVLLRLRGAVPMSVAARWLNLEKGSFTPVARRLMDAGLVECVEDEADRRRTLIRLTQKGQDLDLDMHAHLAFEFNTRISMLSPAEQRAFFASLEKLNALLDRMNPEGGFATTCSDFHAPAPDAQEGPREC
jgi:MarR family transcriptional regulator, organic hydroperoxide resistance regulator